MKKMLVKQGGAFVGAGTLGALVGAKAIEASYAKIPTSVLAAGAAAAFSMMWRPDFMLGVSLGLTGAAANELGAMAAVKATAPSTPGLAGHGDAGWAQSTYRPAEEILGWQDGDYEEVLGEEWEYEDEIEI